MRSATLFFLLLLLLDIIYAYTFGDLCDDTQEGIIIDYATSPATRSANPCYKGALMVFFAMYLTI